MADSRDPLPVGFMLPSSEPAMCPARTAGPLGFNDAGDPFRAATFGDTAGPLGINDHAAAQLSTLSSPAIGTSQPRQAPDDDFESASYDLSYRSERGALSSFLKVQYANGESRDVHLEAVTRRQPKLWAAKQEALRIMDDYNTNFIIGTLPAVLFVLTLSPTMTPVTSLSTRSTRYTILRRTVPRAAAESTARVGRWMSRAEYDAMVRTGRVQQSPGGGAKGVLYPPNPNSYKAAPKGDIYVEFDVPASSLAGKSAGQASIPGPNSPQARLAAQKGLPPPQMPAATNIQIVKPK